MMARATSALAAGLVFAATAWALLGLPTDGGGLAREAHEALPRSGVTNPVTAVLLNYRSYDTLLEIAVLLLALVAVWALRPAPAADFARPGPPVLVALLRLLLPLLLLTGGYVLWIGAFAPGGAFQGGALLGGAIVLMLLGGLVGGRAPHRRTALTIGLVVGLLVFLAVGLATMLAGGNLLEYPPGRAKHLILLIEAAALLSIGLTLGGLFLGGRPGPEEGEEA